MKRHWDFVQVDARGSKEEEIAKEVDRKLRKRLIEESKLEVHKRIMEAIGSE